MRATISLSRSVRPSTRPGQSWVWVVRGRDRVTSWVHDLAKWSLPGMNVKRWLGLLLVGLSCVALGIAFVLVQLYRTQPFPEWVYYFTLQPIEVSDLNVSSGAPRGADVAPEKVAEMIAGLNAEGYWPTELKAMSNPYRGDGPSTPAPGDFSQTRVGDETDTSPFPDDTVTGISTTVYQRHMAVLLRAVDVAAGR